MKYLRRFVWYIASRLLLISIVLGLMIVTFYYAMNVANIYVVLKDGMAYRTQVVMMDADGSMAPQEIPHYLHFLNNGYDFVKGSRFVAGGGSLDITRLRTLGNRFLLGVFNSLYDTHLTDLCYGFCAFHRRYLDHLKLSATGFEIEAEMVAAAMRAGLRIAEVPSMEMPRRSGKSNLRAVRDGTRVLQAVLDAHSSEKSGLLARVAHPRRRTAPPATSRALGPA